jgi:HEXXH motif-containing protein
VTALLAISDDEFGALASGAEDAHVIPALQAGQYSKRAHLLRAVLDYAAQSCPRPYRDSRAEHAFRVLAEVQDAMPAVVTETLLHPQVGGWAAHALRQMSGTPGDTTAITACLRHLGSIAASAALRAGIDFETSAPIRDGQVVLPMLGCVELADVGDESSASIRGRSGTTTVDCRWTSVTLPDDLTHDAPGWRAMRHLRVRADGGTLDVTLDDVDPYRDYYRLSPERNLSGDTIDLWRKHFDRAWALLVRYHGPFARGIGAGLTSIVPLPGADASGVSATSSDAIGAAAISLPEQETELAVALVHELQHSKLSALLDLVPLYRQDTAGQLFYAPWRDDPRPVGGLLQGCYAHLSIASFWRRQRHVPCDGQAVAHFEFARWSRQAWRTTARLLDSGALTPAGERFVGLMRTSLEGWLADPVPEAPARAAEMASLDHLVTWRLRNVRPDGTAVRELARAWCTDEPGFRSAPIRTTVVSGEFVPFDSTRTRLLRHRLRGLVVEPSSPDAMLVAGDEAAAANGYRACIEAEPADVTAWSGLALAHTDAAGTGLGALAHRPEVVYAVHTELRWTTGRAPAPDELATYLAAVIDGT